MTSFLVEDWMMGKGLRLKGIELLVFAHAFSYYRQGKEMFISEGNLGAMIGHSRKHVGAALGRLCEKRLLIRSETKQPGHQTYSFSVCEDEVRRYVTPGCDIRSQKDETKRPTLMGQKVTPTCNLSSHNKEMDNSIDNSTIIKSNTYGNHKIRSIDAGSREEFEGGNVL